MPNRLYFESAIESKGNQKVNIENIVCLIGDKAN
jgi:hypothetical protein